MDNTQQATHRWHLFGRLVGAGLLAATGAIHLDLYLTGYRTIPTIGWLFLLQVIAAFGLAGADRGDRQLAASAAGAGFALSTLGGYVLSVWVGLFGFKEVRTTAGSVAGVIEVAAFAVLGLPRRRPAGPIRSRLTSQAGPSAHAGFAPAPGVSRGPLRRASSPRHSSSVAAASATGAGLAPPRGGQPELKTRQSSATPVLTNAKGFTLYWFAPDSPSKSRCYGTCAVYWPPVIGTPTAGPGVTGTLGTIKRSDGSLQATYDHHPLYTYIGDSAPGQARGNGST